MACSVYQQCLSVKICSKSCLKLYISVLELCSIPKKFIYVCIVAVGTLPEPSPNSPLPSLYPSLFDLRGGCKQAIFANIKGNLSLTL